MFSPTQIRNFSILILQLCIAFGHVADVFGHQSCSSVFSQESVDSEHTRKTWDSFRRAIDQTFAANLDSWNLVLPSPYLKLLQKDDAHLDVLKRLQLINDQSRVRSAPTILRVISREILAAAKRAGLGHEQVLLPAFAFELSNGQKIWRKWGEPIPKDAKLYKGVLPLEMFYSMLADGYFPIGGSEKSNQGTKLSLFEHDLAHLTSFIENPVYMHALREQARNFVGRTASIDESRADLSYFVNEGMLLVKPSVRSELARLLQVSPQALSQITPEQLSKHILNLPRAELAELLRFSSVNFGSFVVPVGGAGRDPDNRRFYVHNFFESSIQPILTDASVAVRLLGDDLDASNATRLARIFLLLEKLSHVSLEDWVPVIVRLEVAPNSRISDAFSPGLWQDLGYPLGTFRVP